jgi:hypothetical protein
VRLDALLGLVDFYGQQLDVSMVDSWLGLEGLSLLRLEAIGALPESPLGPPAIAWDDSLAGVPKGPSLHAE